jgi:hypothetical protein
MFNFLPDIGSHDVQLDPMTAALSDLINEFWGFARISRRCDDAGPPWPRAVLAIAYPNPPEQPVICQTGNSLLRLIVFVVVLNPELKLPVCLIQSEV